MAKLISADLTNNKLCILEYTTTDRQMLSFREDVFDANIVSHTYTDRGKIIYDKPITTIGEKAFCWCTSLASITIPDSVTTIGRRTFSRCPSLTEFKGKFASDDGRCLIYDGTLISFAPSGLTKYTISNSVTIIGNNAFSDCESLTNITIPDSVTTIGAYAFLGCSNLTKFKGKYASDDGRCLIVDGVLNSFAPDELVEYVIPDSVTTIGADAFLECWRLTSVTIPDSVTTIEDWAFSGCSGLTTVIIGKGVSVIGEGTFHGCENLTNVTIPNRVTTIEKGTFYDCKSLLNVTIGDSVSKIDNEAFWKCLNLKCVTIGNSVSEIGYGAFHRSNIETIVCYPTLPPKLNNSFSKFENLIVPTGCEEAYANSDWGKYLE